MASQLKWLHELQRGRRVYMEVRTKTVQELILDDSPVLHLQLQQVLQSFAIEATELSASFENAGLDISADIIFVELLQTCGNGFQLLRTLKQHFSCPLILLSGTGRMSDQHWGLQAGAAAVLARPVNINGVGVVLQQLGLLQEKELI